MTSLPPPPPPPQAGLLIAVAVVFAVLFLAAVHVSGGAL